LINHLRFLIFFIVVFSSLCLSQNKDTLNIKSSKNAKLHPKIGFQFGSHSSNLNQNSSDKFNRDILFEAYFKFDLSSEVHPIIAYTYWKALTSPVGQIPSETIASNGLKLEVDFSLFKIYGVSLSLGPLISIEGISRPTNKVFSLGTNVKLALPLWNDKVDLLTTIGYQTGSEVFAFGGGGFNYSFFSYSVGVEINLGN